jgi:hypothetical protein
MNACRLFRALFLVVALFSVGCEEAGDPTPVCVSVGGVWDVNMVGESGTGITCPDASLVWTLSQTGCDVAIASQTWPPLSGATGTLSDNRLTGRWEVRESCYKYLESIDVAIDGNTMTGEFIHIRAQVVYPADCPGLGICSAALNGVRRAP